MALWSSGEGRLTSTSDGAQARSNGNAAGRRERARLLSRFEQPEKLVVGTLTRPGARTTRCAADGRGCGPRAAGRQGKARAIDEALDLHSCGRESWIYPVQCATAGSRGRGRPAARGEDLAPVDAKRRTAYIIKLERLMRQL